ncbi:MAG TPA: OB-fold nucleic acid binding domain-containing protein, partial [Anaerovoracaceae bacterium]|nr:OB-fold nucleic acid binding domain-containing protein [Anaerovoracaceae bacterium]
AEYAFNKSHAAAYAVIAYETAYLKAYYPVEFMAALMTSVIGDSAQIAKYIRNCNEMQIQVLPPCVAGSNKKFTVVGDEIRFGLLGVKNVGEGVINAIIKMRNEKGIPSDIFQFINNIDIQEVNKKAFESLIKAGAFDCINENRAQLMAVYEKLIESAQNNSRKNIQGQMSLFQINTDEMSAPGSASVLPQVTNFSKETLIALEKEMLGVYITGHPLKDYEEQIEKIATITSDELSHVETNEHIVDGMKVTMAGIISGKKILVTKSNKQMAFIDLEDLYGIVEVIVFPNVYERCIQSIKEDHVVVVKGTINFKEDEQPKLMAEKIFDLQSIDEVLTSPSLKISIPQDLNETEALSVLKEVLAAHKGNTPVIIKIDRTGKRFKASKDLWVNPGTLLKAKLEDIGFILED